MVVYVVIASFYQDNEIMSCLPYKIKNDLKELINKEKEICASRIMH